MDVSQTGANVLRDESAVNWTAAYACQVRRLLRSGGLHATVQTGGRDINSRIFVERDRDLVGDCADSFEWGKA